MGVSVVVSHKQLVVEIVSAHNALMVYIHMYTHSKYATANSSKSPLHMVCISHSDVNTQTMLILEKALQCHINKTAPSLIPILKSASIVRLSPDNT